MSDHAIPYIWFKNHDEQSGQGYWKFNVSLLENVSFNTEIKEMIEDVNNKYSDIKIRWEDN